MKKPQTSGNGDKKKLLLLTNQDCQKKNASRELGKIIPRKERAFGKKENLHCHIFLSLTFSSFLLFFRVSAFRETARHNA